VHQFFFSLFSLWDLHLSLFRSLGVRHVVCPNGRRVVGKGGFVHLEWKLKAETNIWDPWNVTKKCSCCPTKVTKVLCNKKKKTIVWRIKRRWLCEDVLHLEKRKGWKQLGNDHINYYNMIMIRGSRNLMRVHVPT
jgi:hypothetical protein